eukprot:jgi/Mesen1/9975/ME000072S09390
MASGAVRFVPIKFDSYSAKWPCTEQQQQNSISPPLNVRFRTVVASVLGVLGSAMASAGGVGGGGLFVPLFNLLLQFDAKTSAALSKSMVFGGAVTAFMYNVRARHPAEDRPLIDYDIALLLEPALLVGISTGVLCNVMFPSWIIILLLTSVLSYITARSYKSGFALYRRENVIAEAREQAEAAAAGAAAAGGGGGEGKAKPSTASCKATSAGGGGGAEEEAVTVVMPLMHSKETCLPLPFVTDATPTPTASASAKADALPDLERPLLAADERAGGEPGLPWKKLLMLLLVWFSIFLIQLLKQQGQQEGALVEVQPCGALYWLLTLLQLPLGLVLTGVAIRHLKREQAARRASSSSSLGANVCDCLLSPRQLVLYPLMSYIAGCMGGLLGIGGGMIICPLLLELGILPEVTAATGAFMVLFSSSMSVAEFYLLGRIPLEYGEQPPPPGPTSCPPCAIPLVLASVYFAILCCMSSFVGLNVLQRAVKKYNRSSIIIFTVAGVISISVVCMGETRSRPLLPFPRGAAAG